jgi:hypothetical protein
MRPHRTKKRISNLPSRDRLSAIILWSTRARVALAFISHQRGATSDGSEMLHQLPHILRPRGIIFQCISLAQIISQHDNATQPDGL